MTNPTITQVNTGIKWFGLRVSFESSGDKLIDHDLRQLFRDDYNKSAPLTMTREDVKRILEWVRNKR